MKDFYAQLLAVLTPRERKQFWLLVLLFFFSGLVEVSGVASVAPLIYLLLNPDAVESNTYLADLFRFLQPGSQASLLVFVGGVVLCLVVLGLLLKALTQHLMFRFTMMRGYSLSVRLFECYLGQQYVWFIGHNSAELISEVLGEVKQLVDRALLPAMKFVSSGVLVVLLAGLLVVADPLVALSSAAVLGASYGLIYLYARQQLERIGARRHAANKSRYAIASEATGGIKELKLMRLEDTFLERFRAPAMSVARSEAMIESVSSIPRYLLEAVAFGGLLIAVLFLLIRDQRAVSEVAPVLTMYAFAGARLFPALQEVYRSLSNMRFSRSTVEKLHARLQDEYFMLIKKPRTAHIPSIRLESQIRLTGVSFRYPQSKRPAVEKLDLTIKARTTVGIVGGTGAGKTTAVDLILGLIHPDTGSVTIDSIELNSQNVARWQQSVGYVPQHIYLSDDTVAANIAFGVQKEIIDLAAVEKASRYAELHDFVINELPEQYNTLVGERGARLSGGQRQRIGIARALYHNPDVLILDEATSALDNVTERAVMDAVRNLGRTKTIIMIAHRISTVRNCDVIFLFERGRVAAEGSYQQLFEKNCTFRALAS